MKMRNDNRCIQVGFELLSLPAVSLLRHTVEAVLLGVTLKRHNRPLNTSWQNKYTKSTLLELRAAFQLSPLTLNRPRAELAW